MPGAGIGRDYRVIAQDPADRRTWGEVAAASRHLRTLAESGRQIDPAFPDLLSDLFAAHYKAAPRLRPAEECDPESQWNRQALTRIMEGAEHQALRTATMLDELSSAIATRAAGEALLKERQGPPQLPPPPRLRRGMQVKPPAPVDLAGGAGAPLGPDPDAKEVRRAARAARAAAEAAVEQAQAVLDGWGIGPGELSYLPLAGRLDLVERLVHDPRLLGLAAAVGSMRNLAQARWRRRLVPRPQRLVGVGLGGDVALALPGEIAALRHPRLRYEAMYRLAQGRLLQWDQRGRQRAGRGPMIVCCDSSGSTAGAKDWTIKALALGLLEIAWRQRRAFAGVVFSGHGQLDVSEFVPGRRDLMRLLHFATAWFGGLTDFETPLEEAMRLQRLSPYRRADIVFLTDGLAEVGQDFTQAFLAEKRARDVRVLCVLADTGTHGRAAVQTFADEVLQATDFESIAAEIFDWGVVEP